MVGEHISKICAKLKITSKLPQFSADLPGQSQVGGEQYLSLGVGLTIPTILKNK